MMKKLTTLGALAVALLFVPPVETPARALAGPKGAMTNVDGVTEVGHRGGGARFHDRAFRRGDFDGRNFAFHNGRHFRHGPRITFGVPYFRSYPYYGYSYDPYFDEGCEWMRFEAIRTGNSYWWYRYEDCID
jgi:hypothetical protein